MLKCGDEISIHHKVFVWDRCGMHLLYTEKSGTFDSPAIDSLMCSQIILQ